MAGRKKPETGALNITVRGGVDVKDQRYSDKKGDYFIASPIGDITVMVNEGERKYWTVMLDDLQTGERHVFRFSYEMLIGRTPPQDANEVKLVLNKDGSVSGRHCKIYEMSKRLVIEDLGSRNHTFLNGSQVRQATEIPLWGQIQVGKTMLRVVSVNKG